MKILEEKENSLLSRKEVRVIAEAQKNPSFPEAIKIIADNFKANEENIEVKEIRGKFGRGTFLISAMIYKSKEDKEKFEKKKVKKTGDKK